MRLVKDIASMRSFSREARSKGKKIAFVPTMGFLHDGHAELLRVAREHGDLLVMSIFVNPAQFGPKEDFKGYPRDIERDLKLAEAGKVDVVFTPSAGEIYPDGYKTYVNVEGLPDHLCGLSRPGHFRGVATVVLKLFNIVAPHLAVFGKKDFQQLLIIKKMCADLNLDVEIIGVDTVREIDGLAMSSRNSYLSADERKAAACVPRALAGAEALFASGERKTLVLIEKMKKIIEKEPLAVVDYIKVCDSATLEDLEVVEGSALVALAVKIGGARLIDNRILQ
jgi:pantoate--beta-alanine ligase